MKFSGRRRKNLRVRKEDPKERKTPRTIATKYTTMLLMRVSEQVSFRTSRRSQKSVGSFMFMQKDSLKTVKVSSRELVTLEAPGTQSQHPTDPGLMMTI